VWFNKGTLLMQRRAVQEAEASLRRAVELAPENGRYAAYLAWAVMNNDQRPLEPRLDEARRWMLMALEKAEADPTGDTWYFQAMWHKFRGEEKEQRNCLNLCLEQNPRHVDALREQRLLSLRSRRRPASPLEQSCGICGRNCERAGRTRASVAAVGLDPESLLPRLGGRVAPGPPMPST
jgi:tetratricopeptide (TPR) repeat protein